MHRIQGGVCSRSTSSTPFLGSWIPWREGEIGRSLAPPHRQQHQRNHNRHARRANRRRKGGSGVDGPVVPHAASSRAGGLLPGEQRIFRTCQPWCASSHEGASMIPSRWQETSPMKGRSAGTVTWHAPDDRQTRKESHVIIADSPTPRHTAKPWLDLAKGDGEQPHASHTP